MFKRSFSCATQRRLQKLDEIASNGWMTVELVMIWKEAVVTYSNYDHIIFLEGNAKSLSHNIRCSSRDTKQTPLEYASTASPLRKPTWQVLLNYWMIM